MEIDKNVDKLTERRTEGLKEEQTERHAEQNTQDRVTNFKMRECLQTFALIKTTVKARNMECCPWRQGQYLLLMKI